MYNWNYTIFLSFYWKLMIMSTHIGFRNRCSSMKAKMLKTPIESIKELWLKICRLFTLVLSKSKFKDL
jgi:hypothetical protein